MHLQDLLAAHDIGVGHHDLAVEASRPQQGGVQHVRPVGGGDQDHALVGLEAVHLHQQLVQGLLALVVAAAQAGTAMAADRVDFVDEDDAGRVLLALLEHVAHPAGADTHEHLHEVGARDREEGHVGLAGDGAGQQRLTGARRAHQQAALRDLAAEALEALRVAQELHDLLQLLLGLVDARHVLEGDAADLFRQQARLGLAEAHGLAAAALHLAHEEDPDADQQQHREPGDQDLQERIYLLLRHGLDADAIGPQFGDQIGVVRRIGLELAPVVNWPEMVWPWIFTSRIWPPSTLSRKSEKAISICGPRVALPWKRLNRAKISSSTTIQRAAFRLKFTFETFRLALASQP